MSKAIAAASPSPCQDTAEAGIDEKPKYASSQQKLKPVEPKAFN
jgi:hypothetical protein